VEQFEFIKVTEIVNQLGNLINLQRIEGIHSSIRRYLEGAHSKVGNRLDDKFKLVLKEAYDLLEGVKVEIESIQGNILKLLKPAKRARKPNNGTAKQAKNSRAKMVKKLMSRPVRNKKRASSAHSRS
jgi:hypothetical protein